MVHYYPPFIVLTKYDNTATFDSAWSDESLFDSTWIFHMLLYSNVGVLKVLDGLPPDRLTTATSSGCILNYGKSGQLLCSHG